MAMLTAGGEQAVPLGQLVSLQRNKCCSQLCTVYAVYCFTPIWKRCMRMAAMSWTTAESTACWYRYTIF